MKRLTSRERRATGATTIKLYKHTRERLEQLRTHRRSRYYRTFDDLVYELLAERLEQLEEYTGGSASIPPIASIPKSRRSPAATPPAVTDRADVRSDADAPVPPREEPR